MVLEDDGYVQTSAENEDMVIRCLTEVKQLMVRLAEDRGASRTHAAVSSAATGSGAEQDDECRQTAACSASWTLES